VAKPHAPPNTKPVVAQLAKPNWPPPASKSRRRSYRFSSFSRTVQGLILGAVGLACIGGGAYGVHVLFNGGKDQGRLSPYQIAQANSARATAPDEPTSATPPPPPKPPDLTRPEEAKTEPEPKSDPAKTPEEKGDPAKTPEAKNDPAKTPEPKTDPAKTAEPKTDPVKPVEGMAVVFFDSHIKKIMENKCNRCHGDGTAKPKGQFDSRTVAAILKGGASGPGIVPGDPKKSPSWTEIEDKNMPPKGEPQLTDEEKKLVLDWVKGGAKASAGTAAAPAPAPEAGATTLAYEKHVLPILQAKCAKCHDAVQLKGGLNLTTLATLKKGGNNGPAVVPGDLKKSELWAVVSTNQMPPEGNPALTDAEKDILMKWIQMGAKDNKEAMVVRSDADFKNLLVALLR